MKKFQDLIRPKAARDTGADTPEANVARAVKGFIDAGRIKSAPAAAAPGPEGIDSQPSAADQADEVTFLPTIVDCTESSPAAAKEALVTIRKNLELKGSKLQAGHQQYKALMLFRILVDNPGAMFTRNIDAKFVSTMKELYRGCRDPSVRQLLVENMEHCLTKDDPGLQPLKEWYTKEKESAIRAYAQVAPSARGALGMYSGIGTPPLPAGYHHARRPRGVLPSPEDLATRISEAQTSAKLLMQILQSTPPEEVLANQLITEFADRCSAASRSIQMFIEADSPAPDETTMLTLFETNEMLATTLSRHQMALFSAKQLRGQAGTGPTVSRTGSANQVPQVAPGEQTTVAPTPPGGLVSEAQTQPQTQPQATPNYGFSGFGGVNPSPPSPPLQSYPPVSSYPQQQRREEESDLSNPFSDPEPVGQSGNPWRRQEYSTSGDADRYSPSPVDVSAHPNRHPMADASAVSRMPHGYQPYRY
ncbi:hypothetical protein DRE_03483 [Drechslerella stenobrocha 248]|uniref:GAT domain-containing protein n=1 Tax=Drechslerella stenobrocha 248 TaxID=1043628 RepID=W7HUF7_9PEZI|nr:hypothetical protein DRE_03483 [Drechslerella stenobrocha 248]